MVIAFIDGRAEELAQDVTMGTVQFDTIEAGLFRPLGCEQKVFLQLLGFSNRQRPCLALLAI